MPEDRIARLHADWHRVKVLAAVRGFAYSQSMQLWTELEVTDFDGQFDAWVERLSTLHDGANNRVNAETSFAPLQRSLSQATVALVSTAGVHVDDQVPFDVSTTAGDPSFRLISDHVDPATLKFTHTHYDTAPANEDPNVVFPLQRLHEFVDEGRLGSTSSIHVGLMGFNPDPTKIADETAPEVARILADAGVDVAVLSPG